MEAEVWERYGAILDIAEKDAEYLKMKKDFLEFEKQFHEYADSHPDQVRNFLYGFQGMTYLMGNRKLMLACEKMHFPQEGGQ